MGSTPDSDRAARKREQNRQGSARWRAKDPERSREYIRQWRAAHPDKYRRHWHGAFIARKTTAHEKSLQQFAFERQQESNRHSRIKAAQLRKSIMRDGVIADHTAWGWDVIGMIDHAPVDDHIELEPAIIDFQYWFAA